MHIESRLLGYVGLFTSLSTLTCCALPSVFVLMGFGATVASLLSDVPWLVDMSHHKGWLFAISFALIAGNAWYVYRIVPGMLVARGVCPADDPAACGRATRFSRVVLWVSAVLLLIGATVAYVLPLVFTWMDS